MSLMAQKSKNDVLEEIEKRFQSIYPVKIYGENKCFLASNGQLFRPFEFPGEEALAIEYADTPEEARKSRFEDGDRFYLSDFPGDSLFNAMVAEIEG